MAEVSAQMAKDNCPLLNGIAIGATDDMGPAAVATRRGRMLKECA